ncbi:MAG: c-type cytochrome domain-containing protein, partial [Bacteroidota bacterium]
NKVTGGLRMDSKAALLKGGLNGPILIAGQAAESELFHRVTLPGTSRKYMPPNGPRLSYREIRLLDYWIKSGASFDLAISDEKIPKDIQQLLLSQYGLTTKKRPIYERITLSQVEEALLAQVNAAGFKASPIAAANPFLSIRSQGKITAEQMKILQGIKHHITWLDLSNSQIEDEALKSLSAFPHLTRLKLNNNPISDQGIAQLQDLPELTSLNLYGTQVGDASLALLAEWSSLKKLFLWQSKVSQEGVEQFKSARPDVAVEVGLDLAL